MIGVFKALATFFGICFIFYLLGAFVSADFDIRNWVLPIRGVCATLALAFGLIVSGPILEKSL